MNNSLNIPPLILLIHIKGLPTCVFYTSRADIKEIPYIHVVSKYTADTTNGLLAWVRHFDPLNVFNFKNPFQLFTTFQHGNSNNIKVDLRGRHVRFASPFLKASSVYRYHFTIIIIVKTTRVSVRWLRLNWSPDIMLIIYLELNNRDKNNYNRF